MRQGVRPSFSSSLASLAAVASDTCGAAGVSSPSASESGCAAALSAGFVDGLFYLGGEAGGCGAREAGLVAGLLRRRDDGADDVVALLERDALVAEGGAAHGAEVLLVEADGHAFVRGEEDDLFAVGDAGDDELVVLVDADGDDAARHDVREVLQRGLLDRAVARGEEDVLAGLLFKVLGREGW